MVISHVVSYIVVVVWSEYYQRIIVLDSVVEMVVWPFLSIATMFLNFDIAVVVAVPFEYCSLHLDFQYYVDLSK